VSAIPAKVDIVATGSAAAGVPRVIALIDLPDLEWQERIGGSFGHEVGTVVRRLEAGLAALDAERADRDRADSVRISFDCVYVYAAPGANHPGGLGQVMLKSRGAVAGHECTICAKACTHCKGSVKSSGGRGHDNPIAVDLISLARDDTYDWAVIVTADMWLASVVRFIQSRGRKVIHGCFPPIAADLTRECWASLDLRGC
jgi:hypothetical protein